MNVKDIDEAWLRAELERCQRLSDLCHIAGYSQSVQLHTSTGNSIKRELASRAVRGIE